MGILNVIKYNRLKREDVVDAIIELQREEDSLETEIFQSKENINKLMIQGKKEKDAQTKLFIAKKINFIKDERQQKIQKATYLLYNIKLLDKLKSAIDDNSFYKASSGVALNKMLKDQKALAKFLNKALGTRIVAENVLTSADETYEEIMSAYEENDTIYGVNAADDDLLAVFETSDYAGEEIDDLEETDSTVEEKTLETPLE